MATVVDALIMTLGLDTRDYDKGQKRTEGDLEKLKKQSGAVAKEMGEQGKRAAEFFSSIKTELLGLLAVFGAATGLKEFIASNVQGQASLGRLSRNLKISAPQLQAWGLIAKEMGGQAEDAFGALQAFAGGMAEASIKGHSALTDTARANGINLEGIKDSEEGLLRISKRLTELPRQQAMYLANELGVGGMFNQLELGPEELKKRLDAARGLTRVTAESTAAAERLQKRWADIQQRFKETSEIAFARLSPVLERLAERFANWLDSVDWDKVAAQIETLVRRVNEVVQSFGGWKTVAVVLGGVMALKVLAPVLSLVGALGRLVPLLASSTAGLWAMAAAGAAVAGGYVGTKIYDAIADKSAGRGIGRFANSVMAGLGSDTAFGAEQRDNWDELSQAQRKQMTVLYKIMSPAEKADYDKRNPELSRLIHSMLSEPRRPPEIHRAESATSSRESPAGYGDANPTKSRIFDSNDELFSSLEQRFKLPAGLMARMFKQESSNGTNLQSKAGAVGPFQFMPSTATDLGLQGNDVFDLDHSASAAAKYMSQLLKMFGGDITKAVAAYNAGPGNVRKYGGVPPFAETQNYVKNVAPNVADGAGHLAKLNDMFGGDITKAISAYNASPGKDQKNGIDTVPTETQAYVKSVAPGAAQAAASRPPSNVRSSQSTSETHIGKVEVITQATDAKGIAIDMRQALADHMLVGQADTGIS